MSGWHRPEASILTMTSPVPATGFGTSATISGASKLCTTAARIVVRSVVGAGFGIRVASLIAPPFARHLERRARTRDDHRGPRRFAFGETTDSTRSLEAGRRHATAEVRERPIREQPRDLSSRGHAHAGELFVVAVDARERRLDNLLADTSRARTRRRSDDVTGGVEGQQHACGCAADARRDLDGLCIALVPGKGIVPRHRLRRPR